MNMNYNALSYTLLPVFIDKISQSEGNFSRELGKASTSKRHYYFSSKKRTLLITLSYLEAHMRELDFLRSPQAMDFLHWESNFFLFLIKWLSWAGPADMAPISCFDLFEPLLLRYLIASFLSELSMILFTGLLHLSWFSIFKCSRGILPVISKRSNSKC